MQYHETCVPMIAGTPARRQRPFLPVLVGGILQVALVCQPQLNLAAEPDELASEDKQSPLEEEIANAFSGSYAALSENGAVVAVSDWDDRILVYETGTGTLLCNIQTNSVMERHMCLSPDGRLLAVAIWPEGVRVYETESGKRLRDLVCETIYFDPQEGKVIPDLTTEEEAREYTKRTGNRVDFIKPAFSYSAWTDPGLTFSPDGKHLWTTDPGGMNRWIHLLRIDVTTGDVLRVSYQPFAQPSEIFRPMGLALRADGDQLKDLLVLCRKPDGFTLLDGQTLRPTRQSYEILSTTPGAAFAFSPRQHCAVVVFQHPDQSPKTMGWCIRWLHTNTASAPQEFFVTTPDRSGISSLAYAPDCDRLAVGTTTGSVIVWSTRLWHEVLVPPNPDSDITRTLVAFSRDEEGRYIVTAAYLTRFNQTVSVERWKLGMRPGLLSSYTFVMPEGEDENQNYRDTVPVPEE